MYYTSLLFLLVSCRFDLNNSSNLVKRKLKIAALCGGQQATDGVPIWQHDLIVVTAGL